MNFQKKELVEKPRYTGINNAFSRNFKNHFIVELGSNWICADTYVEPR